MPLPPPSTIQADNASWCILVTYFHIFGLVQGSELPFHSDECSNFVLTKILEENCIEHNCINFPALSRQLLSKVKHLVSHAKKVRKRGGRPFKKLMQNSQSATYRICLGNAKRKLEQDLANSNRKRQKVEADLKDCRKEAENAKKELKKVKQALSKALSSQPSASSGAGEDEREISELLALFKDKKDEMDLMTILLIKDLYGISHKGYLKLASSSSLPSLKAIKAKSDELNKRFSIMQLPNTSGVFEPFQVKLLRMLEIISAVEKKEHRQIISHLSELGISISGDGTWVGKRLEVVNISFTLITKDYKSGPHILAICKVPEKYLSLKDSIKSIIAEIDNLSTIIYGGKTYKINFYLTGDMKFLNMVMGLSSNQSLYSCVWCVCTSTQRADTSKKWSMRDTEHGARTLENNKAWAKLKKNNYSCIFPPMFDKIGITHIVPDVLHLYLRMSDQLINQLILELMRLDKVSKNTKVAFKADRCKNMSNFEQFITSNLRLSWGFFTDPNTGMLKYRDFYRCRT